jgi:hypothetical protein
MLDHHDVLAILPNINNGRVGQEYDCDKPPYQVFSGTFFTKGWYFIQRHREVPNMGLYVRLVLLEVELTAGFSHEMVANPCCQCIESLNQPRNGSQIQLLERPVSGSALGQHLSDSLLQLALSLPGLGHPLAEILNVEYEAVEQEPR